MKSERLSGKEKEIPKQLDELKLQFEHFLSEESNTTLENLAAAYARLQKTDEFNALVAGHLKLLEEQWRNYFNSGLGDAHQLRKQFAKLEAISKLEELNSQMEEYIIDELEKKLDEKEEWLANFLINYNRTPFRGRYQELNKDIFLAYHAAFKRIHDELPLNESLAKWDELLFKLTEKHLQKLLTKQIEDKEFSLAIIKCLVIFWNSYQATIENSEELNRKREIFKKHILSVMQKQLRAYFNLLQEKPELPESTFTERYEQLYSWVTDNADACSIDIFNAKFAKQNFNFQRLQLNGVDLSQRNLPRAYFSSTKLYQAKFSEAILQMAKFVNTNLEQVSFKQAKLENAEFSETNLIQTSFEQANLEGAEFSKANLKLASFKQANLKDAKFSETNLEHASFKQANLEGAEFVKAELKRASFDQENLKGVKFSETNLEHASFKQANLEGAEFSAGTKLAQTSFEQANLTNANFNEMQFLPHTLNFLGANLKGMKMTDANRAKILMYNLKLISKSLEAVNNKTVRPQALTKSKVQARELFDALVTPMQDIEQLLYLLDTFKAKKQTHVKFLREERGFFGLFGPYGNTRTWSHCMVDILEKKAKTALVELKRTNPKNKKIAVYEQQLSSHLWERNTRFGI